jgi:hypothetical protein
MTLIIAYAVAFLMNLGVVSKEQATQYGSNLRVFDRDGKTVVYDSITGHEIIIAL